MDVITIENPLPDIAIVRINRPEALNALNTAVFQALKSFLEITALQNKYKAVILTGTGDKAFIAGADIREMQKMNADQMFQYSQLGQHVADVLETAPYLTLAAINGFALGGGLEMALACDFIYATKGAKMGMPEVSLGLIPGFGGIQRLQNIIGKRLAKELIMSGRSFYAEEAKEMGIVNHLSNRDQLLEDCINIAKKIVSNPFSAIMQVKRAINVGSQMKFDSALELERNMFSACSETQECKIALKNFLEKRKG